ncbi:uncharacterized protein PG998_010052 [Apiospora kogelbergensis]
MQTDDPFQSAFGSPSRRNGNGDYSRRRFNIVNPGDRVYPNKAVPDEEYDDLNNDESEPHTDTQARHDTNTASSSHKSVRFSTDNDGDQHINSDSSIPTTTAHRNSDGSARSSTSSIAGDTLRRASQAVDDAVDAVATQISSAYASFASWRVPPLFKKSVPMILIAAILAGFIQWSLSYAARHPYDTVGYAAFVRELCATPQMVADAWRRGQQRAALRKPTKFNVTQYLEQGGELGGSMFEFGPWGVYEGLLRDVEMETWFDEVRGADDVISALWTGLPAVSGVVVTEMEGSGSGQNPDAAGDGSVVRQPQPVTVTVTFPGGGGRKEEIKAKAQKKGDGKKNDDGKNDQDENTKAVVRRLEMRSAIDMRSTMRKRAEAYFENFLAGRAVVIGQALADARRFGELVEAHTMAAVSADAPAPREEEIPSSSPQPNDNKKEVVGPKFHTDVAARLDGATTKANLWKKMTGAFREVRVHNRTNYVLSYAGLHLARRLLDAHQTLYAAARPEPADLPANLKGNQTSSLFAAPAPDVLGALSDLRRSSAMLPGSASLSSALDTLIDKLEGLEEHLQSVGRNLAWVSERLAAQVAAEMGEEYQPKLLKSGGLSNVSSTEKLENDKDGEEEEEVKQHRPLIWSQTPQDLVESWGRVLDQVAEARGRVTEHEQELRRKKGGSDGTRPQEVAMRAWRVGNCAGASCYGEIMAGSAATIGGGSKKEKAEKKKTKGWFWQKSEEQEDVEKDGPDNEGEREKGAEDVEDTPEMRAVRERFCCGYSMHNEWADILMYGDKQFAFQDLYSGQQPEVASG